MAETYWAAKPTAECIEHAEKRIDQWFEHCRAYGKTDLWRRMADAYYAGFGDKGMTGEAGGQGELTTVKVNHLHNLVQHITTMIAGQTPVFQPQAATSDHEATAQTIIAQGLLDSASTQKGMEPESRLATLTGVLMGEGYMSVTWDPNLGHDVGMSSTGVPQASGDVSYCYHTPLDVARDANCDRWTQHKWIAVRYPVNRWDLMAQRPDLADAIESAPAKMDDALKRDRLQRFDRKMGDSDEVYVWRMYHAKSPALPSGRMLEWLTADAVLSDGPLPYDEIPVYRVAPEDTIGNERGYTTTFDLAGPQHVINSEYSTMLSNHAAFGVQNIAVPSGSNVTAEDLSGLKIIRYSGQQPPSPLNLLQTPAEVPQFAQDMISQLEIISGVNAVRRGNIDSTGKLSGAAYALIDAKALEYAAGIQTSYRRFMADAATATIKAYQRFATAEYVVKVTGKSNRSYSETFTKDKISGIQKVDVELGNPLQRTVSGRLQLVQMLYDMQLLKTPEQVFQVITSGRLEPVTEGPAKELDNIKAENEMLGEGGMPVAVAIDNHPLHIEEHSGVLASPEARQNPQLVQVVTQHIQEHITLWQTTDPMVLASRRIPPPPMAVPQMPPDGSAPPPGAGTPGPPIPPQTGGQDPNLPQMPVVAGTNERAPDAPVA